MINPDDITTVRVGELPPLPINLTDNIPHEIGTNLFRTTVQDLADLVKGYIGTVSSLAFNPTTVADGGTLPATTTTEWILVGMGAFHNVAGFPDIITTQELNALVSNGTSWSIGVEIPINVELAGIVQTIRSGYTQTTPSEDAVFNALALKLNITDLPELTPDATDIIKGKLKLAGDLGGTADLPTVPGLISKTENSAGAIQGFAVTDNGNGTVNIASGTAFLRATNDQYAPLLKYTIPAVTNLVLTDNANNYVLVDYNGGLPALTATTNGATINTETNSIAILISRVGNTLDWLSLVGQNIDANAKIRIRFLNQEGIRRANGAIIGFVNRNLTLTSGVLFSGLIRINSPAFNTASPDTFIYVYNNGPVWTRVTAQNQVNNTQYNNAGTLATMPNNDYRTDYVYLLPNNPSKLYVVYGTATYNSITLARNAPLPASLPSELQVLGLLVGRQIVQKNAASISEVSSAFDQVFVGVGVPEHNSLAGLQGGATNDYQHLTSSQLSDIAYKSGTTFTGSINVPTPTTGTNAVTKAYADGLVVGLLDDRGSYDASTNIFPTTGGSGTSGVVLKGDLWYVSVAGTLGGKTVAIGDSFRAMVDSPAQVAGNWSVLSSNLGYVPENVANKQNSLAVDGTNLKYPTVTAVISGLAGKQNTLTNPVTGTGVNGQISFWNGTNSQTGDSGLIWDNTNKRLGVGTSPMFKLDLRDINGGTFFDGTNATYNRWKSFGTLSTIAKPLLISAQTSGTTPDIYIHTSGGISIGNTTDPGANNLSVTGKATAGTAASASTDLMRKGEVDTALALKADATALPTSGTYTPTASSLVNITSITNVSGVYTRIGNIVTVTVRFLANETVGATQTSFIFTLPINRTGTSLAYNFGTGNVSGSGGSNKTARVDFNANNSTALLTYLTLSSFGSSNGSVTFQYDITQ